jgi:hypothetical protein
MAITTNAGRQNALVASMPFTFADFLGDDTYTPMVDVPVNAIVTRIYAVISTLFDSGTDDKFSIGDQETGGSADKTEYAALSADITAVGVVTGIPTAKKYTVGGTVGMCWNPSGTAATAGAGTLFVEYIIDGRATEVNP